MLTGVEAIATHFFCENVDMDSCFATVISGETKFDSKVKTDKRMKTTINVLKFENMKIL